MINKSISYLIELSKAEAAIAIAISECEVPPLWASNCFEDSVNERDEESEANLWVPNELVYRGTSDQILTLEERIQAEQQAVISELAEQEHGYYLLPLHATCGIAAHAIISISGFSFTGLEREVVGYADDCDVLPLIRSKGVRAADYRKEGIRAVPSFKAAVEEAMQRVPLYRHPHARGAHAGMMNASHGNVRRNAARWFISNYIEEHRSLPVGSFSFEVDYGPDLPVKSNFPKESQGRLSMTLHLRPS